MGGSKPFKICSKLLDNSELEDNLFGQNGQNTNFLETVQKSTKHKIYVFDHFKSVFSKSVRFLNKILDQKNIR